MKINTIKKLAVVFSLGLGIYISTPAVSLAVTYDISAEGSCGYGITEIESNTSACWAVYQTATLNASQERNTNLSIFVSRTSFHASTYSSDFSLIPACGASCNYPMRTNGQILGLGPEVTIVDSGQTSNTRLFNTGPNVGATNVIFTTYLTTNVTCRAPYNFCTVETPVQASVPFTVTAPAPSVQLWFSGLIKKIQSTPFLLFSTVFAMDN